MRDFPTRRISPTTFATRSTIDSGDSGVHRKLTDLIGRSATLAHVEPPSNLEFYKRYKPDEQKWLEEIGAVFAREPGEPMPDLAQFPPELMEYVAFPGTFFDVTPLHLLSTSSLAFMKTRNPEADWDIRRFRPNILVDTGSKASGLAENAWIGKSLKIGTVVVQCPAPTPRCGMTTREQPGLRFDKTMLRTIVKEAEQNLGVYGVVGQPGDIKVGDDVELID